MLIPVACPRGASTAGSEGGVARVTRVRATSRNEFATWLTPGDALARMGKAEEEQRNRRLLLTHLFMDEVRAIAASAFIRRGPLEERKQLFPILPGLWSQQWARDDADFWQAGQIRFWITEQRDFGRQRVVRASAQEVVATGVRLNPADIDTLWPLGASGPAVGGTPEPAEKANLPRLPEERLKEWHLLFVKAYPKGSATLAEKSAKGAFPNHQVSRERVRALFPDVQPGRPRKDNEKS